MEKHSFENVHAQFSGRGNVSGIQISFLFFQEKYGDIFSITLGSSKCIVINDAESVKEVLIAKGAHFDGRPDFKRFDMLFGGDKQNCKFNWFYI